MISLEIIKHEVAQDHKVEEDPILTISRVPVVFRACACEVGVLGLYMHVV